MDTEKLLNFDKEHIWHPYTSMTAPTEVWPLKCASGVRLTLADGTELIDGASAWWCASFGYNHPALNAAIRKQLEDFSHIMFAGFTHEPAVELTRKLLMLVPDSLTKVFYVDSGSVAVEAAIKMAIQYQTARGAVQKNKLLTVRGGYHGDTLGAMALCDPVEGMHSIFSGVLSKHFFAPRPQAAFDETFDLLEMMALETILADNHQSIAAIIIEPVFQGASAMRFYSPEFLKALRKLADLYGVLLIFDEIATGFGRTGRAFACDYAGVQPDIMCVGKGLTAGTITLAALLTTDAVAQVISDNGVKAFMHGPTYMANALACAAGSAAMDLYADGTYLTMVKRIEKQLEKDLAPARTLPKVKDVRALGAIGVIEMKETVDTRRLQDEFVRRGVWIRPFGSYIYTMPPFIITEEELAQVTGAMVEVAELE